MSHPSIRLLGLIDETLCKQEQPQKCIDIHTTKAESSMFQFTEKVVD